MFIGNGYMPSRLDLRAGEIIWYIYFVNLGFPAFFGEINS